MSDAFREEMGEIAHVVLALWGCISEVCNTTGTMVTFQVGDKNSGQSTQAPTTPGTKPPADIDMGSVVIHVSSEGGSSTQTTVQRNLSLAGKVADAEMQVALPTPLLSRSLSSLSLHVKTCIYLALPFSLSQVCSLPLLQTASSFVWCSISSRVQVARAAASRKGQQQSLDNFALLMQGGISEPPTESLEDTYHSNMARSHRPATSEEQRQLPHSVLVTAASHVKKASRKVKVMFLERKRKNVFQPADRHLLFASCFTLVRVCHLP